VLARVRASTITFAGMGTEDSLQKERRPVRRAPWRVFLSHTSELRNHPADRSFIAAAEAAVVHAGHAVTDMAYFAARESQPADYCTRMVAAADVYVGIIGHRYGTQVCGRAEVSYTELEFETATGLPMPRLIFLVDDETCPAIQSEEHADRQAAFRDRLRKAGLIAACVASAGELEIKLHQSLVELGAGRLRMARSPRSRVARPQELPRPPADFTGRETELASLRRMLSLRAGPGRPVVISAVDGMAGIGKSALAIHEAHELAEAGAFPDGQLYVNLQGASAGLPPIAPLDALGRMLRSLGVHPAAIPTGVDEAAARFRSLAAGRRLLILLDNASSAEQVRPLLPGSPSCAVLVTSRQVLATLEGAQPLHLGALPHEEALELLGRIAGQDRVAAEPQASEAVVRRCEGLPLAIRIAGARLAARPRWPVQELADQLADATRRLQALETGELAVRASFDVSLHALRESRRPFDHEFADALGLLSLPDGPDLGLPAAARLLDRPDDVTRALLERLVDAQLLESQRSGRYQFHDLVRLYAREQAGSRQPEPERRDALTRIVGFYTATGWHTMEALYPGTWRLGIADQRWTGGGLTFTDASAARTWLVTERSNLLAAIAQGAETVTDGTGAIPAELPCQLIQALFGFFFVCNYWQDWLQASKTVLKVAGCLRDRTAEALAHNDLGIVYERLGWYARAIDSMQRGLEIFQEQGVRLGRAAGLNNLSIVYEWLGRHEAAIDCLREALGISEELGDRLGQARCLENLGAVFERLGQLDRAIDCITLGLEIGRELCNGQVQARCLNNLGLAYGRLGRSDEAVGAVHAGLALFRDLWDRQGQVRCLHNLGIVYAGVGRHGEAVDCQQRSLAICREIGDRRGMALALRDLGDACRAVGQDRRSQHAWREGLEIAEALQIPEAGEIRARLDGAA
jgi:tetratricopeptide (TPR) repeat protein